MVDDADQELWRKLTSSDDPVLALVKEGRVDAEIAVRLGISNAEVKERIERLVAKHGVKNRAELREPPKAVVADETLSWAEPPGPEVENGRLLWPSRLALLVAVVAAAIGLGWASQADSDDQEGDDFGELLAELDLSDYEIFNGVRVLSAYTPPPQLITADGQERAELGKLFLVANSLQPVEQTVERDGKTFITLEMQALFLYENGTVSWRNDNNSNSSMILATVVGNRTARLHIERGDEYTDFLFGDSNTFGIFTRGPGLPVVKIWVDGATVTVDSGGRLSISFKPVD